MVEKFTNFHTVLKELKKRFELAALVGIRGCLLCEKLHFGYYSVKKQDIYSHLKKNRENSN